jgi:hypothetical protein
MGTQPPRWCQNKQCRSRQWNGKKAQPWKPALKLPTPRKRGRHKTIALLDTDEQF